MITKLSEASGVESFSSNGNNVEDVYNISKKLID